MDRVKSNRAVLPVRSTVERGTRLAVRAAGISLLLVVLPLAVLARLRWAPLLEIDADLGAAVVRPGHGADVDLLHALSLGGDIRLRVLVCLPLVAWLTAARRWQTALFVASGLLLVSPLNELIKRVVERPRPSYQDVEAIGGMSYPSGHSSGSAALATVVIILVWPLLRRPGHLVAITIGGALMVVVGGTRVLLGVHYPSDVFAGWLVGVSWVIMMAALFRSWPGQVGALGRPAAPPYAKVAP